MAGDEAVEAVSAAAEPAPGAVTIRPAGPADLPRLAALYVDMAAAHGLEMAEADAAAKLGLGLAAGQRAVIFEANGQNLGMCVWADLGDHRMIRNFVIGAGHRGRGLGAALFARLCAEVFADGRPVRLEASADHARAFWEAQGLRAWSVGLRSDPF